MKKKLNQIELQINSATKKLKLLILLFILNFHLNAINISTNIVWNSTNLPTSGYNNGISILAGGSLTIDGLNLQMINGAKITVAPPTIVNGTVTVAGGKLIIKNSVIDKQNQYKWDGIYIEGDNINQFTTLPDKSQPFTKIKWQGVLNQEMSLVEISNTTIKNSDLGVQSIYGGIV